MSLCALFVSVSHYDAGAMSVVCEDQSLVSCVAIAERAEVSLVSSNGHYYTLGQNPEAEINSPCTYTIKELEIKGPLNEPLAQTIEFAVVNHIFNQTQNLVRVDAINQEGCTKLLISHAKIKETVRSDGKFQHLSDSEDGMLYSCSSKATTQMETIQKRQRDLQRKTGRVVDVSVAATEQKDLYNAEFAVSDERPWSILLFANSGGDEQQTKDGRNFLNRTLCGVNGAYASFFKPGDLLSAGVAVLPRRERAPYSVYCSMRVPYSTSLGNPSPSNTSLLNFGISAKETSSQDGKSMDALRSLNAKFSIPVASGGGVVVSCTPVLLDLYYRSSKSEGQAAPSNSLGMFGLGCEISGGAGESSKQAGVQIFKSLFRKEGDHYEDNCTLAKGNLELKHVIHPMTCISTGKGGSRGLAYQGKLSCDFDGQLNFSKGTLPATLSVGLGGDPMFSFPRGTLSGDSGLSVRGCYSLSLLPLVSSKGGSNPEPGKASEWLQKPYSVQLTFFLEGGVTRATSSGEEGKSNGSLLGTGASFACVLYNRASMEFGLAVPLRGKDGDHLLPRGFSESRFHIKTEVSI